MTGRDRFQRRSPRSLDERCCLGETAGCYTLVCQTPSWIAVSSSLARDIVLGTIPLSLGPLDKTGKTLLVQERPPITLLDPIAKEDPGQLLKSSTSSFCF